MPSRALALASAFADMGQMLALKWNSLARISLLQTERMLSFLTGLRLMEILHREVRRAMKNVASLVSGCPLVQFRHFVWSNIFILSLLLKT